MNTTFQGERSMFNHHHMYWLRFKYMVVKSISISDSLLGPPSTVLRLESEACLKFRDRSFLAGFHFAVPSVLQYALFSFCPRASLKLCWETPGGACLPCVHVSWAHSCMHVSVLCTLPVSVCVCVHVHGEKEASIQNEGWERLNECLSSVFHGRFCEVFYAFLRKTSGGTELQLLIAVVKTQ